MKKIVLFIVVMLCFQNIYGQVIKKHPPGMEKPPIKAKPFKQEVILYEHPNYSGRFQTLAVGQYPLGDFNDLGSSIEVPAGMVVIIYEHANPTGGSGNYVDLMENCPDLSVYNFNGKVSYVSVINISSRPGHVWVRNRMVNNEFIPGHWERARSDGRKPDNSLPAIVSVIKEPTYPVGPTVLVVNGANTTITSLGVQTVAEKLYWEKAMNQQLGIIGNDFRGLENLGTACFQRASNNIAIPDNFNFWYPQKRLNDNRIFKRTLIGTIQKAKQYYKSGTFEDFDMNIDIYPDPSSMYLLTEAHKPYFTGIMKTQYYGSFTKSGESGCPGSFDAIEAEIADRYRPPQNYTSKLVMQLLNRYGQKIGVYGPWIYDEGHCRHPEIHPAEQVWWSEPAGTNRKFNLNVFCDASGRFLWRSQMDDGTKLKPWGEPPIKGLFAIAFEHQLPDPTNAVGYASRKFEVANIQHNNVIEYPNADQTYNLVFNGKNIASFVPHNNAFKVSFEQVGYSPDDKNKIRGFLIIETSVGVLTQIATEVRSPLTNNLPYKIPAGAGPGDVPQLLEKLFFKKESGYYSFTVTESVTGGSLISQ